MTKVPLEAAAEALRRGEVVAIPTDTVYGLAVLPGLRGTTAELFKLKRRPDAALPVLVAEPSDAIGLAEVGAMARALMLRWWPGPLTLVLPRGKGAQYFDLGGDPGSIGLRCPDNAVARQLLERTGPLAVTSANLHGEPPCHTAEEVSGSFGATLLVLDGGTCEAEPSTVISLIPTTLTEPHGAHSTLELLRLGTITREDVLEVVSGLAESPDPSQPGGGRSTRPARP